MATLKPFKCIRPDNKYVSKIAALPYDVYNRQEAHEIVKNNPLSFLSIDRGETNFENNIDIYSDDVYKKCATLLEERIRNGIYIEEKTECLYLYELIMNGLSQTGIVGCASVDDYINGVIKKHENTRTEKELDRTKHIEACKAHTGPIFLAYRTNHKLRKIINEQKESEPIYDFTSEDGIRHIVYRIENREVIKHIQDIMTTITHIYIADGHHRAAAAVNVACKHRTQSANHTGNEEYNYFLSVFFAEEELRILDYNRVVKDLNGLSEEDFLDKVSHSYFISELPSAIHPSEKGSFTMYLNNRWYLCKIRPEFIPHSPVAALDVSLLQDYILDPILGIHNPKEDTRIDFVGGLRGLEELEKRCDNDCKIAFAMYPTSIHELFEVADAGLLMPPKSTWFEPKLRSGIFVHRI